VFWGGLRGSIPIALVLGLPVRRFADIDAVAVVFAVVLFSLIVQGITYKPLLDRLGLTLQTDELGRYERVLAQTLALKSAGKELEVMRASGEIAGPLFEELHHRLSDSLAESEHELAEMTRNVHGVRERQMRSAARRLAAVEKQALSEGARSGRIGDPIARDLTKDVDIVLEGGAGDPPSGAHWDPALYPRPADDEA
jgi:CPA1 family monovalent cation:H+ antiporter